MKLKIPFLFFLCISLLVSCSNSNLPKIKNSQELRKDCLVLYQQIPLQTYQINNQSFRMTTLIPIAKWSNSILDLHPSRVVRDLYGIRIVTATSVRENNGIWATEGYFVQCNQTSSVPWSANSEDEGDVIKKIHDGIYEFYQPCATQ
jgi:hypothetical protein